jgi:AcrR family transcriptional regulator
LPASQSQQVVHAKKPAKKVAVKKGWQAEKSAMTRTAILEAAIECFISLGYASTTTALIAEHAGVSRGAMMHHFPSRASVLKATIDHLHAKRIVEYKTLMANIDEPAKALSKTAIRESVSAAWKYVNLPTSIAFLEILVASRTDPELEDVLQPLELEFERNFLEIAKNLFPHWQNRATLDTAHDVVHFLLNGMMMSHMASRKGVRAKRILAFLADSIEHLYEKGERDNS